MIRLRLPQVTLVGAANVPKISLSAQKLDFGTIGFNETSYQDVKVVNESPYKALSNLTFNAITGKGSYTIIPMTDPGKTACAPDGSLAIKSSCWLRIQFSGAKGGVTSGSIEVGGKYGAYIYPPKTIGLVGKVNAPLLKVSTSSLNFGSVSVGNSADLSLTLTNSGLTELALLSISSSSTQYSVPSKTCAATLAVNASCTVTVRFTPTTVGTRSAGLLIKSSDKSKETYIVTLTGIGL